MKRLVLLLSAFTALSFAPPAVAEDAAHSAPLDPAQARRDRFSGAWIWTGRPEEITARDDAVDRGIKSLFFAIRGIARSRIQSSVAIRKKLGFAFRNGTIVTSASGRADAVSPETGVAVPFKGEDGKSVKLTQSFTTDARLQQTFHGEEGGRSATFTVTPDGKTLRATYKLFSPKLSTPIVYTLTYRRE